MNYEELSLKEKMNEIIREIEEREKILMKGYNQEIVEEIDELENALLELNNS